MAWSRRRFGVAVLAIAFLTILAGLVRYGPETAAGRTLVLRAVNGLALGSAGRLGVQGLSGDPWRAVQIERLTLSDAQGVWLDARGVSVEWRPLDLVRRQVSLTSLTIDDLRLERRPNAPSSGQGGPMPVSIRIDRIRARFEMSPAFATVRGDYGVGARLDWERSGFVDGHIVALSRLHAGDRLEARLRIDRYHRFALIADAREARGGALAGSLGLAADQPFLLAARAAGSPQQGRVMLDARVGTVSPLVADADWSLQGGRASGVVVLGASRLLAGYAAILGPRLDFNAVGRRAPDGFDDFSLTARMSNATLVMHGEVDLGRRIAGAKGLALNLKVADGGRIFGYPRAGPMQAAGLLFGDAKNWRFLGAASLTDVDFDGFRLARVSGPLRLHNEGRDLVLQVDPSAEGSIGAPLAVALLGPAPRGSATLDFLADGRLLVQRAIVQGSGVSVQGTGSRGLFGGLSFAGSARFTNLAIAHAGANGSVKLAWKAAQSGHSPWSLDLDAQGSNLVTGFGDVDHLLGRTPGLQARGDWDGKAFHFANAILTGAAAQATGSGTIGGDGALDLKFRWLAKGPLSIGPLEVDGAAQGSGDLAGDFGAPKVGLAADFGHMTILGLPLTSAHLALTFASETSGANGRIELSGAGPGGPAVARSDFRMQGDGVDLTDVSLRGGGIVASGSLSLRSGEPSTADLDLAVGPGLLLTRGHATGRVRIFGSPGAAQAHVSLTGSEAILAANGLAVKRFELNADGPLSKLPFRIAADGPSGAGPWRIAGSGAVVAVGQDRLISFAGESRLRRAELKTLSPVTLRFGSSGLTAHGVLGVGAGRAIVDFTNSSEATRLDASLANVDLSLLDREYVGLFSGRLSISGRGPDLSGRLDAHLSRAGGRDLRGAPPVDGDIEARLAGRKLDVGFHLNNSAGFKSDGEIALPMRASAEPFELAVDGHEPISGHFTIDGEIKPLWDLLFTGAENLSGRVDAAVGVAGTPSDPSLTGQVALDGGRLQDENTGLQLQAVSLRARLTSDAIDVGQFSGVDGLKGKVSGAGRASLAREGASNFRGVLSNFRLIDTDLAHVTASGPFTVNRAADGRIQIAGVLTLESAQISPNPPVATGVTPLEVVEIHRPIEFDDASAAAASAREAPIGLDVALRAPGRVFLKGRGLDLELSVDGHVGGTAASPILTGVAHVVRGDYDFAGQRFRIDDRGVIRLASTPDAIRLDLTATREDPTLTAVIHIRGTAAKPTITLTSTPALPQDEILSRVLFGASASQLSGLQAAQLASAIAGLSGGGGFDLIGGLRSLAHLDRLAIGGTAATGTTFSGGKYIGDRLYLQLTGGGRDGQSAQLEWQIRKRLSLVAKFGTQGESQIAIRWRRGR